MAFRDWMICQDWEGKQLDKDLLYPNNKVYSPETCLFVTSQVNVFMTDRGRSRGDYPIGVVRTLNGKYKAQCCNLGKGQVYLGLYETPELAHTAYARHKSKLALELANIQTDHRVAEALIKRYAA